MIMAVRNEFRNAPFQIIRDYEQKITKCAFCAFFLLLLAIFIRSAHTHPSPQTGYFRVTLWFCFKTSAHFSSENEFDLHENEPVGRTHIHMNGFAEDSF